MSEQFAMQPDEFDSTNNRLDSILDRLNALGESAASMKDAPLRPLQSVPPLDPNAPGVIADQAPTDAPAPNLGLVPPAPAPQPMAAAPVAPAPVEAEPAVPAPAVEFNAPQTPVVEGLVAQTPMIETVQADLPTLPEVPSLPDSFTPVDTPVSPVAPAPVAPAPVAVEHYGLDLAPTPVAETVERGQVEAMDSAAVFELDAESLEAEAAIDPPEAPTSIFSLASAEPAAPTTVSPEQEADGWVSYHDDDPTVVAAVTTDEDIDPMWAVDPIDETPAEMPVVESTSIEEPASLSEQAAADPTVFETPTIDVAAPTEESIDDFFAGLESVDEPDQIAGIDVAPPVEELTVDASAPEAFTSDDDLPIPDFTGVYNDSTVDSGFWADSEESVPKAVETSGMGQASTRRDELDKLRPVEGEEPIALEKESADRSVMLQIVGVIFVGILAVLAVFLLDPAAVADMRESLEGLLG